MAKKLTKEEQLIAGIEFLALGRKYILQDKKKKQTELLYFLDELHNVYSGKEDLISEEDLRPICEISSKSKKKNRHVTSDAEKLRKKYEPYVRVVEKKFGITVDFQSKFISYGSPKEKMVKLHEICKFYIGTFCKFFSDDSLVLLMSSREEKERDDLLYLFVLLKYSIQFELPIEFKYRKIMHQTVKSRKVIPYLLTTRNGYLSLIGKDIQDRVDKSFILNGMISVQTDLEISLHQNAVNITDFRKKFDLENYEKTNPSAKFHRIPKKYRLKLFDKTYGHFKETYSIPHKLIEKENDGIVIEFETIDFYLVFQIIFNYGTYCILLSPVDEVGRFKEKLNTLSKLYK